MQVWEKEPVLGAGDAGRDTRGMDITLRVAEVDEELVVKPQRSSMHACVAITFTCSFPFFSVNWDLLSAQILTVYTSQVFFSCVGQCC